MLSKNGLSELAKDGLAMWNGKKRPRGWRGGVWGIVVHSTGSALPSRALSNNNSVLTEAHVHYIKSQGTHYTIGYDGTIVQVAHEDMQANGVGISSQRILVEDNGDEWYQESFSGNSKAHAKWVSRWKKSGAETPLDLFPSKSPNSCYVHCELPPCVFWYDDMLQIEEDPHAIGMRFTTKQHLAVARLAVDVADRNRLPDGWWKTSRLVGHEDISPLTRHTTRGCWDPGGVRELPWFDWDFVYNEIEKVYNSRKKDKETLDRCTSEVKNDRDAQTSDTVVYNAFLVWVKRILGIKW